MKKTTLILAIMFVITNLNAKTSISGTVKDNSSNEPIPFAIVNLYIDATAKANTTTDFDGNFIFKNIEAGVYKIEVSNLGYNNYLMTDIKLSENQTLNLEIKLEASAMIMASECQVTSSKIKDRTFKLRRNKSSSENYYSQDYNQPAHNTESYDYINENKFKNVIDDPLSTFSIDVDRASYANVRRFLNSSSMPYKDAVRIEEMINYFDYEYEKPNGEHPFSTHLELGECPWNTKNKLLMIGIQGECVSEDNIPPCNLVFLIDVSGSMDSPNKLPLLKSSFKLLIEKLRPQDNVAIVVYAGSAGCVLPSTKGDEREQILKALNNLEAGGSTAGGEGIKLAYKIAAESFIKNGNNRVILATDGDFNVGASSDSEMERLIEKKRDSGIYLTVLGFGMGNYKDSKMEKLANKGNGNYAYIDNILEANKMFGHELWGTLYTIAKDVKIQIEFNPAKVKEYRLIGYEDRLLDNEDFDDDKKDAGEIGSGHTVTALYELVLADNNIEFEKKVPLNYQTTNIIKSDDIMTLKIRYKKPDKNISNLITNKITDKDLLINTNSNNFLLAAAVAEFGMLLRGSEFKENSNYKNVTELAKKAKGDDKYGYRAEFLDMVKKATLLSKTNNNN